MKSRILFGLFILCNFCFLNAQDYTPFPQEYAEWTVFHEYPTYGDPIQHTSRYFLNGDTIINGKQYTQVYKTNSMWGPSIPGYFGGIREKYKIIYFKPAYEQEEEYKLYDFNLEIGDIWDTAWDCDTSMMDCCVVAVADTFKYYLQNGDIRNGLRLGHFIPDGNGNLEPYYTDTVFYWIEGIGSTMGLMNPTSADECGLIIHPGPAFNELLCFSQNGFMSHFSSHYFDIGCYLATATHQAEKVKLDFDLFPNPITNSLNITTEEALRESITAVVTNPIGQITHSQILPKGTTQSQLDLSTLSAGIYLITFSHSGKILQTERVVKHSTD